MRKLVCYCVISLMACCLSWNVASKIEQKSISQRSLYNSVGRIVLYKEGFETGTFPIECVIESECDTAFQMQSMWRYALEFAVDNERDVRKKNVYERYLLDIQRMMSK